MATTAGIYLTHASLDLGPEFESKVWAAIVGAGVAPTPDSAGAPAVVAYRNGARFSVYLLPSSDASDPSIAKAKAVLVVSGMPTLDRVSLALDLGGHLSGAGFSVVIDDEALGFVRAA